MIEEDLLFQKHALERRAQRTDSVTLWDCGLHRIDRQTTIKPGAEACMSKSKARARDVRKGFMWKFTKTKAERQAWIEEIRNKDWARFLADDRGEYDKPIGEVEVA